MTDGGSGFFDQEFALVSFQKPNMRQRIVEPKPIEELAADFKKMIDNISDVNNNVHDALSPVRAIGKSQSFYWDFHGGFMYTMPSAEMANVVRTAYTQAASMMTTSLEVPNYTLFGFNIGTTLGFIIGKSFILGLGTEYSLTPEYGSFNSFSDGNINITMGYSTLQIFGSIGLRLIPDNKSMLMTLTLEPGISLISYQYNYEFAASSSGIDASALGFCLNLRYQIRFANRGSYLAGKSTGGIGLGLVASMVYANQIKNDPLNVVYYNENGYYYTSSYGGILPDSKLAEYFNFNIGFNLSYGFSL